MKACATCKYWKKIEEYGLGHGLGLGACENIPVFSDSTEWDEEGEKEKFLDQYNDTKAFTVDGGEEKAYLLTRPDFGCVSHAEA